MNRHSCLSFAALLAFGLYCTQVVALTLGDYVYSTITVPDSYQTRAAGINKQGQIVGDASIFFSEMQTFIRQPDGSMQFLPPPGPSCSSVPTDINDLGHVIGFCNSAPFFFDGTNYTFLPIYNAAVSGMNIISIKSSGLG